MSERIFQYFEFNDICVTDYYNSDKVELLDTNDEIITLHPFTDPALDKIKYFPKNSITKAYYVTTEVSQVVYVSEEEQFRNLSPEEFALLNSEMQSRYVKKETKVPAKEEMGLEVVVSVSLDFNPEVYLGTKKYCPLSVNTQYSGGWGSAKPRVSMMNYISTLPGEGMYKVIKNIFSSTKVTQVVPNLWSSEVLLHFLEHPWDGAKKKKLSTKSNGRTYADKRGYFVPNYPKTVDTAKVSYGHIVKILNSRYKGNDPLAKYQELEKIVQEIMSM